MWGFLVALISGALMSIQGVFNTEMGIFFGIMCIMVWIILVICV